MRGMSERNEAVTVRRLPDGPVQSARIENLEGPQLLLSLFSEGTSSQATAREFEAGTLIEIQSEESILLGAVVRSQDARIAVTVEHAINRTALAEIEEAWRTAQA
jgi:hypothetical protein